MLVLVKVIQKKNYASRYPAIHIGLSYCVQFLNLFYFSCRHSAGGGVVEWSNAFDCEAEIGIHIPDRLVVTDVLECLHCSLLA